MSVSTADSVVIVGAGPTGVVAAIAAARRGYSVTLLEAVQEIKRDPRASTFHPSTLEMLDGLGLIDEFIAQGLVARYFDFWDKPRRSLVARMDHQVLRDDTKFPFVVQTEQHKLSNLGLAKLSHMPNVTVRLGCEVTGVDNSADKVTVHAQGPNGPESFSSSWLIGCDGGRSTVRKSMEIEFEGYTWPERFVVLTTLFDFETVMECSRRSYLADPDGWANLFKVAGDDMAGRWRVVFPTQGDESDADAVGDASARQRLSSLWPGADDIDALVNRNLYRVHQRVAKHFRKGRVFLAGDAAHVNNPIGGLGLNSGIHDVIELINTLDEVRTGADESLLDRYERRRRQLNIQYVQQQTVNNKKRLEEKDPAQREVRFNELRAIADDKSRQRAFLRSTSLLDSVRDAQAIS